MRTGYILTGGIACMALAASAVAESAVKKSGEQAVEKSSPLSLAGGLLKFDLEERLRVEARDNGRDFDGTGNDPRDDGWLLNRFRLGLEIRPVSWMKAYAQAQDAREWFSSRGAVPGVNGFDGGNSFDLRQSYLEFGELGRFPLSLTVGRQGLSYGDRRLVADPVWTNLGRSFDGVKLRYQTSNFWVDGFAVRPVQLLKDQFDGSDVDDNFFGIYTSTDALSIQTTDAYFFFRDKSDSQPSLSPTNLANPLGTWNGPPQRICTIGTRWKSKTGALNGFDYTAEIAGQFGNVWTVDKTSRRLSQHAFASALLGGYTWERVAWKPRLGLEYDYATGDKDPFDGSSQSFQTLFPSNHAKYGLMDEFAWRNLNDVAATLNFQPLRNVDATLEYHAFWLAQTTDYWWTTNGNTPLRLKTPGRNGQDVRTVGANSFAGQELDFSVIWKPNTHLNVQAGYSHFFAGTYLADTGAHDDADFGYVSVTLNF